MNSSFDFQFHVNHFLAFNAKRVNKQWSTPEEEKEIKRREEEHAQKAQQFMPDDFVTGLVTPTIVYLVEGKPLPS